MIHYEPAYEVWGCYSNEYGECDNPTHLEDCSSYDEAVKAAAEYCKTRNFCAFIRNKDAGQ